MTRAQDRTQLLQEVLAERILLFDGAMGTAIQSLRLVAEDFGGSHYEGCNENLVQTRPEAILNIHREYLEAGADVIRTDTFGGTAIVLGEYGLQDQVLKLNQTAAELACRAAEELATSAKPRFVAGSMGPTTKAISVTGGVTFPQLVDAFYDQAAGLVAGGVDLLLMETQQDTRNIKAGLIGIWRLFDEIGYNLPVMVSGTIERTGAMLAGQSVESLSASLMHADLLSIGLNCATGPEFMTDHIRALAAYSERRVSCIPNAGLPNEDGCYLETPEHLAATLERFIDEGWLNIAGGCCGTHSRHIRLLAEMIEGKRPRVPGRYARTIFSGIDHVEASEDQRPLIVGERTNEVGSRRFKRLISEEKYEEASEIARHQVKNGAQICDVNLQNADRDELRDIELFYDKAVRKVRVPFMIDTTDPAAAERALTFCQGKSIINSINLEDGLEKFEQVLPLARRYGAALVVGCIDEDKQQAQAVTRERKLEIAVRSYQLLTESYGVRPEDIIFDPLVFPCASGDKTYVGSAIETIEGVRLIKQHLPASKTILGISNVSFGLPEAGREILNSVFLYHCNKAGLDLAIVNSEKLTRYASIDELDRHLAEDLLFNQGNDPIGAFAAHFRATKPRAPRSGPEIPIDQRLANYIIEGTKEGLIPDLDLKLKETAPMSIINGPLMTGMDEVGRLFNNNELIVSEVLQSAEAMKAAVSYLEGFMAKNEQVVRGRVILATVKGDVHDIGKNLVEIILSNNGYQVFNLGIKVPPEVLIQAVQDHRPDVVGLSGLLVKSTQQMVITAGDLRAADISVPIVVGGAALSNRFTRNRIAPAYGGVVVYASDAMTGLDIINRLMKPESRAQLESEMAAHAEVPERLSQPMPPESVRRSTTISVDIAIPPGRDLERHVVEIQNLDEVWSYLNPQMLYGRHLGLRGRFAELIAEGDTQAVNLQRTVDMIKDECRKGSMRARAVWQFFEAEAEGNQIHIFSGGSERNGAERPTGEKQVTIFKVPRQLKEDGLALSDFILPPERIGGGEIRRDLIGMFVTTAGIGINRIAEQLKTRGEYLRSYALQALALETAEALAEWLHARMRSVWGIPDSEHLSRKEILQARYRGKRYSFGYPACPDLESQTILFELLRPEEIGVQLTDGFMMEPEASVSALVFHHPQARYFSTINPASGS